MRKKITIIISILLGILLLFTFIAIKDNPDVINQNTNSQTTNNYSSIISEHPDEEIPGVIVDGEEESIPGTMSENENDIDANKENSTNDPTILAEAEKEKANVLLTPFPKDVIPTLPPKHQVEDFPEYVIDYPNIKPTASPTPTVKPSVKPTKTPKPTDTVTPSPTPTLTPTPEISPTATPIPSPEPSQSPTPTVVPETTLEPTIKPTQGPECGRPGHATNGTCPACGASYIPKCSYCGSTEHIRHPRCPVCGSLKHTVHKEDIKYTYEINKEVAKAIFDELNRFRKDEGKEPLKWNDEMYNIATKRAIDCIDDYSHDGAQTTKECLYKSFEHNSSAEQVAQAWKDSSAHYKVIISDFKQAAVAQITLSNGISYNVFVGGKIQ